MSTSFFFFNDTATTEIYTLSLHDALPIWRGRRHGLQGRARPDPACGGPGCRRTGSLGHRMQDRKSTRLNSSHQIISYAVFCLKKKKNNIRSEISSRTRLVPMSSVPNAASV